jgi:hypothetical protein
MESAVFDELQRALDTEGPAAALDRLCTRLREAGDYNALFYALLMKNRHELGVNPLPTGPAQDLPASAHAPYEEAIRQAGRLVGNLYLQEGNLPQAYAYFRMLGEPGPVRDVLDRHQPGPDEDLQTLVQIAFYEGVHPRKGFDWILDRFGICNAITTLSSQEFNHPAEDRQYCLRRLVRALYEELRERLTTDVERREGKVPEAASAPPETPGVVRRLLAGRDKLFDEDCYHVDTSHLSSVVQMSLHLEPCPEMQLARELCAYGAKLSKRFQGPTDPPFEDLYRSHDLYLGALAGDAIEEGLAYFREQAENADPETIGTYPAEVYVNLLLKLNRPQEALTVARKHLMNVDGRRLTCPGIAELCQKAGDYRTLAEVARQQGDAVHFLAGLLASHPNR